MTHARTTARWILFGGGGAILAVLAWLLTRWVERAAGGLGFWPEIGISVLLVAGLVGLVGLVLLIWERATAARPDKESAKSTTFVAEAGIWSLGGAMAAGARFAPAGREGRFTPFRFRLPTPRCEAILTEAPDRRAVLTFVTGDAGTAALTYQFRLGDDSGQFAFERAGDRWEAEVRLTISADEAFDMIETLEVSPADPQ